MKADTKNKLQAILDARNKAAQEATARGVEQQNAVAKNVADFTAKKEAVIKPAFQEIVDLYGADGVTLRIVEEDERTNKHGASQFAYIKLDMSAAYSRTDMKPGFTLYSEKGNRNLSLHTATPSQAGPAGSVSLDDITADWIQDAFLKYQSSRF
jgi:hypothetical protein